MENEEKLTNEHSGSNHSNTFDDVFQSLKANHTRLFIPLINYRFNKNYSLDEAFELLPTDEYITSHQDSGENQKIYKKISDFIIKIRDDKYLLECQSYNDGSMALRIAEYTFLTARQDAVNDNGKLIITMPSYTVIYIRSNSDTPRKTEITYKFPNGAEVKYDADNILLSDFTKEEIIEKKLFVLIPFYMLRYESVMKDESASYEELKKAEDDLDFFISFLQNALQDSLIDGYIYKNLLIYMNMVIKHVTNGNNNEKEMLGKMGGNVIVTEADKIYWKIKEIEAENEKIKAEKDEAIAEKDEAIVEKNEAIAEKEEAIAKKDDAIAILTQKIEELKKQLEENR